MHAMSDIEQKARRFATFAHGNIGHRRKYTNELYIVHPASVVKIIRSVPHTAAMICAAWLHDTVEDTPATLVDIEYRFGSEIAGLVEQLTDVSTLDDGDRTQRKAIDRGHTAKASPEAKTIKLADLIDNTGSIIQYDPKFAVIYMAEKALLLDVLKEGDKTLWNIAKRLVDDYYASPVK